MTSTETAEERMAENLTKRIAKWHDRFDETGDAKYLTLAAECDRMYRRLRNLGALSA